MATDGVENVPGLLEVLSWNWWKTIENEVREDFRGLVDPNVAFDPEAEPVPMSDDHNDHSTMPSLFNTTSFTEVPYVEIVGEKVPP